MARTCTISAGGDMSFASLSNSPQDLPPTTANTGRAWALTVLSDCLGSCQAQGERLAEPRGVSSTLVLACLIPLWVMILSCSDKPADEPRLVLADPPGLLDVRVRPGDAVAWQASAKLVVWYIGVYGVPDSSVPNLPAAFDREWTLDSAVQWPVDHEFEGYGICGLADCGYVCPVVAWLARDPLQTVPVAGDLYGYRLPARAYGCTWSADVVIDSTFTDWNSFVTEVLADVKQRGWALP